MLSVRIATNGDFFWCGLGGCQISEFTSTQNNQTQLPACKHIKIGNFMLFAFIFAFLVSMF